MSREAVPGAAPFERRVAPFVNKTVSFRFCGRDLAFHLSHALFSSFDIDDGTRLLLKTLGQRVDLSSVRSILDVGCGVGVIGACLAAVAPEAAVTLQDRDALAVEFAAANCRANGLSRVRCECALAFHGVGNARFDLVVSNLPAKAGAPVLRAFLRHSASVLSDHGQVAVVVVSSLAKLIREAIDDLGGALNYQELTHEYAVYHFRPTAPDETGSEREGIEPYIRNRQGFEAEGVSYALDTVYSLPDFDTLGRATELLFQMLEPAPASADALIWNPGQGHVPSWLVSRRAVRSVTLAGRDRLELAIAGHNVRAQGLTDVKIAAVPGESWLADALRGRTFDLACALPRPVPRVPWQGDLAAAARGLLGPGGRLVVASSSTEMHRFLDQASGLRLVATRKRGGLRAAALEPAIPR